MHPSTPELSSRVFWKTSRALLFAGFGGLLLIMVFAAADGFRLLRSMQERSASIQLEFLERSKSLNQIRSDLYLSGTYARDYLLDPQPNTAEKNRVELDRLRRGMAQVVAVYANRLGADEKPPLESLGKNLDEYWRILNPMFQWTPEQRRANGFAFWRDEVFPRRLTMLGLADQIESVNERQMNAGNRRVGALFDGFQTRLGFTLAVTIGLGVLLAFFTGRRILVLEEQAAERLEEVTEARRRLKNLSARLVDTQEEERRKLSRELHDEVGQSLSAILVGLSNMSAAVRRNKPAETEDEISTLRKIVEATVRVVRNITLLLRPSMLDDLGLAPALDWHAREVSRQTGLRVDIAAANVLDELPEEIATCIFRVVQEALHNVARHASATCARIVAQAEGPRLLLTIQDDGCGFDPTRTRGLGLLGMRERVANLGGTLDIDSEPGHGALITVSLPLVERLSRSAP